MVGLKSCCRTVLGAAFALVACWTGGAMAQSQEYPNKPIRFMVGFPPGGSTDIAARLPQEIVRRLNADLRAILEAPDLRERFLATGLEPAPTSPEEFGNIIRSEISRWAKVIKDAGIRVE